eukprot:scpid94470/ scgid27495/ 
MCYGIKHEPDALASYSASKEVSVVASGLVIHLDKPWLSASPDGLVLSGGVPESVVEVKCPYTLRNGMTLKEFAAKPSSCLVSRESELVLNPSHTYHFQVPVQMHVCNVGNADFVVWSPNEVFIQRIRRDILCLRR